MLTSEQRAHDIAILCVQAIMRSPFTNPAGEERFDVYAEYLKAYKIALEVVERDFNK